MPATHTHDHVLNGSALPCQRESIFARKYAERNEKIDYWDPMYEELLQYMARLPPCRLLYRNEVQVGYLHPARTVSGHRTTSRI
jgi:hypothetical protein